MDHQPYEAFFLRPTDTWHRRYEALARFLSSIGRRPKLPTGSRFVAAPFATGSVNSAASGTASNAPFFFRPPRGRPLNCTANDSSDEEKIEVADVEALSLEPGRRLRSRTAGVFLFWPLLRSCGSIRSRVQRTIRVPKWCPPATLY